MNSAPARSISKRGRVGEGRPTKRSPEVIAKIAEAVAKGLTDEEAALLAGINPDTMTEWRKDPEFSGAIKRAEVRRLLLRLERIEAGEQGWQGTAWALERIYPARFARPEVLNQIAVVKASAERVIGPLAYDTFQAELAHRLENLPGWRPATAATTAADQSAQQVGSQAAWSFSCLLIALIW